MREHSRLSPSSAERWISCSGSVLLPPDETEEDTRAADEGTLAHRIAELILTRNIWEDHAEELELCRADPLYSQQLEDQVRAYTNYVIERQPDRRYIEKRVELNDLIFGTCDCILADPEAGIIEIIDFKTGRKPVKAKSNPQLRLYGLGAAKLLTPDADERDLRVRMTIFQPGIKNISTETLTLKELKDWYRKTVSPAVEKVRRGEICRNTGSWCRYCNRQIRCGEYNRTLTEITISDFFALTDEQVIENLEKLEATEALLKKLKQFVIKKLEANEDVPGYKLQTPKKRSWRDSESLRKKAREFELTDLISVAQAEKRLGKAEFQAEFGEYVETTPGSPRLQRERRK